ncbi:MAG: transcription elongation factor GreB [Pseudohongiellaceae bacterium]
MSRYRPPQKPGSSYITLQGQLALKAELHQLWKVERPQVTQSVSEAAALGDRSENAEYIYGKKRLREIDRRVRYLSKRLEEFTVVSEPPSNPDKIFFGAYASLEQEDGQITEFRIVGPDELAPKKNYISIDGLLGRALLGKQAEDEVEIESPSGTKIYWVVSVRYDPAS